METLDIVALLLCFGGPVLIVSFVWWFTKPKKSNKCNHKYELHPCTTKWYDEKTDEWKTRKSEIPVCKYCKHTFWP